MTSTFAAVSDALDRLGDLDNDIWSRDEMELYLQDRYDEFCRRSKALFDIVVIENLPPVGNWQTDLERYLALQMPGLAVSDGPFHFTDDSERNLSGGPSDVGGTYRGPAGITNPNQRQYADDAEIDSVPTTVLGGYLPDTTVEVLRVAYDNGDLLGLGSQQMRRIDPNYETREGDPQFFTYDKDGLFFLRVIPAASGDATYPTINGAFGTLTQFADDESTLDDPIGYWPMEDATTPYIDMAGSNNLVANGGNPTELATGKNGYAVNFGSVESTNIVTTNNTIALTNGRTYSFWFNPPSGGLGGAVLYHNTGATLIHYDDPTNKLSLYDGTSVGTTSLVAGTFYHVAYVYDGNGGHTLYLNGAVEATHTTAAVTGTSNIHLALGTIDELAYFDSAFTSDEIETLYNSGAGNFWNNGFQGIADPATSIVTQEITGSGTGGYGILRYRSGDDDSAMFPSGGPWGSPTRIHPTEGNIKVEVTRLGRRLATHGIELPPAYTKYVIFGAMARALRRDGPGQDIALADLYDQRFEQGLERITGKLNKMSPERVGRFRQPGRPDEFGLGLPIMPSAYENPWR